MPRKATASIPPWEGEDEMGEVGKTGLLSTVADVRGFVLAGNAYITLRSKKTAKRYTYRVATPQGKTEPHFVSVLYGDDNSADYTFIGTIKQDGHFHRSPKLKTSEDDPRPRGFRYMWENVAANKVPGDLEIWHQGRCGRCGRLLTVPESIARGIGPECANKMMEAM